MHEIDAGNAANYLRRTGRVPDGAGVVVQALSGGVSNVVLRVEIEGRPSLVLKQSRERLRTRTEWTSRLDRIWTEKVALVALARILPRGSVPHVLFEDRENYLFAMSAAPAESTVWKAELLSGVVRPEVARAAGETLGIVHASAVGRPQLLDGLEDTSVFDELRVDPFYRTIARAHEDLRAHIEDLVAEMGEARPTALVLGDFSPKNVLVHSDGLTLVDFETAHAGDAAFDVGFFLSHVILKAFRAGPEEAHILLDMALEFLAAYLRTAGFEASSEDLGRACRHSAACLLARIDGKSPVDYVHELDPAAVRSFARSMLFDVVAHPEELLERCRSDATPGA